MAVQCFLCVYVSIGIYHCGIRYLTSLETISAFKLVSDTPQVIVKVLVRLGRVKQFTVDVRAVSLSFCQTP